MEPLTWSQTTAFLLAFIEKLSKHWKWLRGFSRSAKIERAKELGFRYCREHYPPGVLIEIRENGSFRGWKCDTCGVARQPTVPPQRKTLIGEPWMQRRRG